MSGEPTPPEASPPGPTTDPVRPKIESNGATPAAPAESSPKKGGVGFGVIALMLMVVGVAGYFALRPTPQATTSVSSVLATPPVPAAPLPATKPVEQALSPLAAPSPVPSSIDVPAQTVSADQWVVHLGAYKEIGNVKLVLAKLKGIDVPAYTEQFDSPQGSRTRVRAGPFPNREAAEKARAKIKWIGIDGPVEPKGQTSNQESLPAQAERTNQSVESSQVPPFGVLPPPDSAVVQTVIKDAQERASQNESRRRDLQEQIRQLEVERKKCRSDPDCMEPIVEQLESLGSRSGMPLSYVRRQIVNRIFADAHRCWVSRDIACVESKLSELGRRSPSDVQMLRTQLEQRNYRSQ